MMKNKLLYCNLRFVFQTKCKIVSTFTIVDSIPSFSRFDIIYKFQCGGYNTTCYGKTKLHVKVRMYEHLAVLTITRQKVRGRDGSAINSLMPSGNKKVTQT